MKKQRLFGLALLAVLAAALPAQEDAPESPAQERQRKPLNAFSAGLANLGYAVEYERTFALPFGDIGIVPGFFVVYSGEASPFAATLKGRVYPLSLLPGAAADENLGAIAKALFADVGIGYGKYFKKYTSLFWSSITGLTLSFGFGGRIDFGAPGGFILAPSLNLAIIGINGKEDLAYTTRKAASLTTIVLQALAGWSW